MDWIALALVAALAVGPSPTPALAQTGYPAAVETVLREARATCREEGGRGTTLEPGAVLRRDLNADGRDDYVINHRDIACEGAVSVFCGTAGCHHVILLARGDGRYGRILDDRILGYAVEGKLLSVQLHGAYCDKGGTEECRRSYPLDGRLVRLD
jgi:hypothetical protein